MTKPQTRTQILGRNPDATEPNTRGDRQCFTLPNPWWSTDGINRNRIHQDDALTLQKRMGAKIWDGLFFDRDSITNPVLTILDNVTGKEIIAVLSLYRNREELQHS